MIPHKGITCQLEKMTKKSFLANFFNKFGRKISCNIKISSSDDIFITLQFNIFAYLNIMFTTTLTPPNLLSEKFILSPRARSNYLKILLSYNNI